VKNLSLRVDGEGRGLFFMKRAQSLVSRTGSFERDVRANHVRNIVIEPDFFERSFWYGGHDLLLVASESLPWSAGSEQTARGARPLPDHLFPAIDDSISHSSRSGIT
jgi:hypothetical protein